MNNDKIVLNNHDNYWIYTLGETNINEFKTYEGPYFTLPNIIFVNYDTFKIGDIIIFVSTYNKVYIFVGFIQLNSKVLNNKTKKIRIFKDNNLNINYVALKFRLICQNIIKINEALKTLKINEISDCRKFGKYIDKREIMKSIPFDFGKQIVKYLAKCNHPQLDDVKSTNSTISSNSSVNNNDTDTENDNNNTETNIEPNNNETNNTEPIQTGMIPVIICPCNNFDICNSKNKIHYFVDHYKTCNKCNVTNNNDIELGSIINNCSFDFHNVTDNKSVYVDPPLTCYFSDLPHEPVDYKKKPFIRIAYINNGHRIYDKCIIISWII